MLNGTRENNPENNLSLVNHSTFPRMQNTSIPMIIHKCLVLTFSFIYFLQGDHERWGRKDVSPLHGRDGLDRSAAEAMQMWLWRKIFFCIESIWELKFMYMFYLWSGLQVHCIESNGMCIRLWHSSLAGDCSENGKFPHFLVGLALCKKEFLFWI